MFLFRLLRKIHAALLIILVKLIKLFFISTNQSAMEVTNKNFESVLADVKKSVEEATFLTIDCELTGLNTISNINAFDTIEEYYNKIRRNCNEFLVIQYGLSAFRYDKLKNIFKQSSYNFYIFRRPVNRNIPDQRFLCQSSSIDFLVSQGFDFNKLFKEGIPYLNLEEENKYQQNLEEKHKATTGSNSLMNTNENKIAIPPTDKPFIEEIIESIKIYLKSGDNEPMQLPKCNPFLRKLIYQTTAEIFGEKINLQTKQLDNKERLLYVSRVQSADELNAIMKQRFDEDMKIFNQAIGFTKILRTVVDSGILVIGHNLMLDLLHTIDKFLTPLPEDYNEFKDCAQGLFPKILDTKFMSSSDVFKDLINSSVLGHLVDSVKEEPFEIPKIEIESGCKGYSLEDKKEHEAGFDAFITGVSFLAMWNYLGKKKNLLPEETFSNFNLLRPFMNRIFLMRLQDNQFIYLGGLDPNPTRDHVFHISFPKEWKVSDIQQLFSPFGNVFISWINDTSAFVGLYKRDQASIAFAALSDHESCIVTRYSTYKEKNKLSSSRGMQRKIQDSPLKNVKKRKVSLDTHTGDSSISEKVLQKKKSVKASKTFEENEAWD